MATTVAEKIIRIDVVASANAQRTLNAMAADMKKIEGAAATMQRSVSSGFGNISGMLGKLAGFLGAFGITAGLGAVTRAVIEAATSYQVLEARMSLVLGTYERAEKATERIAAISIKTGRELDGVAKLYEKASRSAQQFGISEGQVEQITLGFSQSIRLSGASTQEAYAALVQFGQALASGRLQGDEFRSLMENNAVFMYEFAKAAGISVSALRKMGTEGKLSAKFLFDTMAKEGEDGLNMMERLNKMAESVSLTFGQSMNSLKSSLIELTGETTKALSMKSEDKYGIFGPWIRGIQELTSKTREMIIESRALDEGFFARWWRLAKLWGGSDMGKLSPGVGGILGMLDDSNQPLSVRLDKAVSEAEKKLEGARARVATEQARYNKMYGGETSTKPGSDSAKALAVLAERRMRVEELEEAYIRARKVQSDFLYGERNTTTEGTTKPEPDAKAEKKLASARETLKDFVEAREREAEANKRVATGQEEVSRTAKQLVELEGKLKEALVGGNSELAKRGRLAIEQNEYWKKQIDAQEEFVKSEEKLREAEKTDLEKVQQQILRDQESIDALNNRTRATDELTDAMLRKNRADAENEILHMDPNTQGAGFRLDALRVYTAEIDKALAKKVELMDLRADKKQQSEQAKIDAENEKRIENTAEEFNRRIKDSILKGSDGKTIAEALKDNIIEVVGNTTVDIILNPITSVFSRILANLADQFSLMLTKSMFEAMSNTSSDKIGMLINLLGLSSGGGGSMSSNVGGTGMKITPVTGLAKGMSYVPYDNFSASLHRGERVLTARENAEYSSRGSINISNSPVITIDSRTDQAVIYNMVAQAVQQGNVALVEEMRAQGVMP